MLIVFHNLTGEFSNFNKETNKMLISYNRFINNLKTKSSTNVYECFISRMKKSKEGHTFPYLSVNYNINHVIVSIINISRWTEIKFVAF